jgi:hypothetical protein
MTAGLTPRAAIIKPKVSTCWPIRSVGPIVSWQLGRMKAKRRLLRRWLKRFCSTSASNPMDEFRGSPPRSIWAAEHCESADAKADVADDFAAEALFQFSEDFGL